MYKNRRQREHGKALQHAAQTVLSALQGAAPMGGMGLDDLAELVGVTASTFHRHYLRAEEIAPFLHHEQLGHAHRYCLKEDAQSLKAWIAARRMEKRRASQKLSRERKRKAEQKRRALGLVKRQAKPGMFKDPALIEREIETWLEAPPKHVIVSAQDTQFRKRGPASVFELAAWRR